MTNLNLRVPTALSEEVEAIAAEEDKKPGAIGRFFVIRGMAAYRRDHLLEEPVASEDGQESAFSNPFDLPVKGKTATFISLHQLYSQLPTTADKRAMDEMLAVMGREMEWRIKRAVKE